MKKIEDKREVGGMSVKRILSLRLFKKRDEWMEYIRQAKLEAEKFRKKKN